MEWRRCECFSFRRNASSLHQNPFSHSRLYIDVTSCMLPLCASTINCPHEHSDTLRVCQSWAYCWMQGQAGAAFHSRCRYMTAGSPFWKRRISTRRRWQPVIERIPGPTQSLSFFPKACPPAGPVVGWMNRAPQFQLMVVFISSPLTLVVALWGMTSTHSDFHDENHQIGECNQTCISVTVY